ncbi:MAG: ABC transporter substrate-binding protein [Planctomycetota bacterium]
MSGRRLTVALASAALVGLGALAWLALRATASGGLPPVVLDTARARPQGDFLVGAFPEPAHLNPFTNIDPVVATWVLRWTHDTLCRLDPRTARAEPSLAERVEADGEGGLRIELRRDARFADGTPVVAADVAFSHACARARGLPASAVVRAAGMVDGVEVVAPYELRAHGLRAHWAARDVFTTGLVVVSRAAVEERLAAAARARGEPTPSPETPEFGARLAELADAGPGSGPYMLAPVAGALWQRGQHLDLIQNPHAWHRRAWPESFNLAGFRHVFVTEPAAQLAMARRDALDWLAGDVRAWVARDADLRARFRVVVYDAYALGHFMVAWNCRSGPLADARVRRALAHLFDRDTIVRELLHGDAVPAAAWFKPGTPDAADDLQAPAFDVGLAKNLLADAGFGDASAGPLRIEIVGAAQEPLHRRILELAQPAFAAAGVVLEPRLVEAGVLRQRLQQREFMGLLALKYHPDPWIDPWPNFHSSQAGPNGQNWMGFTDPETDRLLDTARSAGDAEARHVAYRAFCRRVDELQPVALLVHPRTALLVHRRFENAEVGVTGLSPQAWWVRPEAQLHR